MNMNNSTFLGNQRIHNENFGFEELAKLLPIAVAITFTNGLVLVMFYRRKSLHTASNYLLLSLASSDFLTGTVSIPFFIAFNFNGIIQYGTLAAHLMHVIQTLLAISGSYHILVITGEMHFAIANPLRHQSLAKSIGWKLSFGVWIISAAFSAVSFAWWKRTSPIHIIAYSASFLFIVFIVPYIFMIYAYVKMFIAISKRKIPGQEHNLQNSRFRRKQRDEKKYILVFATMAMTHAVCWMPYFTVMLIVSIELLVPIGNTKFVVDKVAEVFAIIRFLTSLINPLLYTFFKRDFRKAFKILCGAKGIRIPNISITTKTRSITLRETSHTTLHSIFSQENVMLSAFSKINNGFTDILDQEKM
ncbi:QRFP-like peptide receptor [Acropora muricata]|uniref:QRFP-like peptide receptor n=1 Tax=Acropora muricata TaxID=159855 RepID=UPI0034E404E0